MIVSPNLGLKIWNLSTDPYNSSQLAENLQKIDDHDHANGRGKQIPTGGIADGAITNAKLDPNLALFPSDDSVSTVKIQASAVTTAKIADANVTTVKIADSNVTTAKVADGNVTKDKLESVLASYLGVDAGGVVRRKHVSIDTDDSTASTTVGGVLLANPDQLNVTVPPNGLIIINYSAWIKNNVANNARARLLVNGSPVQVSAVGTWTNAGDYTGNSSTTNYSYGGTGASSATLPIQDFNASTGAAPSAYPSGNYSVGATFANFPFLVLRSETGFTGNIQVQYWNNTAGTTNVQKRRLTVWTMGF